MSNLNIHVYRKRGSKLKRNKSCKAASSQLELLEQPDEMLVRRLYVIYAVNARSNRVGHVEVSTATRRRRWWLEARRISELFLVACLVQLFLLVVSSGYVGFHQLQPLHVHSRRLQVLYAFGWFQIGVQQFAGVDKHRLRALVAAAFVLKLVDDVDKLLVVQVGERQDLSTWHRVLRVFVCVHEKARSGKSSWERKGAVEAQ